VSRQRHTVPEIAAKLAMADDMAAQGRRHGDIAKSLGISVMTYHRWRKARGVLTRPGARTPPYPPPHAAEGKESAVRTDISREREQMSQIRELQLENSRLRRLVADLLLEKVKLEESLQAGPVDHRTLARG